MGEHTLHAMQAVEPERVLRLTMLFHDLGKPDVHTVDEDGIDHFKGHAAVGEEIARNVLRRLKFDNDTIDQVKRLVFYNKVIKFAQYAIEMDVSFIIKWRIFRLFYIK